MIIRFVFPFFILLLFSCSKQENLSGRELWESLNISTYSMIQQISCYCFPEEFISPKSIIVENNQIKLINTPSIYHQFFDETLEYSLNINGFVISERYISSLILINDNIEALIQKILKNKKRTSQYYDSIIKQYNISFHWEKKFKDFYTILLKNKNQNKLFQI